jgi:formiminotetrahydrofolate cyclodeaminase
MFADLTVRELLDRFASSDPTPGGGSAAALAGALGASLLAMVAGMPKTKTGTPDERTALDAARADLLVLREKLLDLVDRDTQAYEMVVAAYRLPKNTDEEKAARKTTIQHAMVVAAEVPLETMQVCSDTMKAAQPVAALGNRNAISDIGTGMVLLASGMQGGAFNVTVNLDGLSDTAQRKALAERAMDVMRHTHEAAGDGSGEGWSTLWRSLAKHAGQPDLPPREEMIARAAIESLRQMATPDARQALEALGRSADARTAEAARTALERLS